MRLLLLLVIFVAACSTPTQYAQGVPMAPRPPAFNPVTDSPITIGQPGYGPTARVVPQPNPKPTRLLPPTREPGFWAGTDPQATVTPFAPPLLLEAFPVLPEKAPGVDHMIVNECSDELRRAANKVGATKRAPSIDDKTRQCLAVRLLWMCIDHRLSRYETTRDAQGLTENISIGAVALARAEHALVSEKMRRCQGVAPSQGDDDLVTAVYAEWRRNK